MTFLLTGKCTDVKKKELVSKKLQQFLGKLHINSGLANSRTDEVLKIKVAV